MEVVRKESIREARASMHLELKQIKDLQADFEEDF